MEHIIQKLRQFQQMGTSKEGYPHVPRAMAGVFGSAWETQTESTHYSWHGLKRGGDAAHPLILFQYTLSGWGYYRQEKQLHTITPQLAFTTLIPSNHHYYLPAESPHWTFLWLIIRHPYIVARLTKQVQEAGPVLTTSPDSLLIKRALEVLEQIYTPTQYDPFAEEEALFRFLIEYERSLFHLHHPPSERSRLLGLARIYVLRALPQPMEVEQLATHLQMSRSAFSHHFKTITGQSPAHYMTQVRLEEATSKLLYTQQSLEEIAVQTGFANATHFCKVFRRHFQLSPGEFRRQMSG